MELRIFWPHFLKKINVAEGFEPETFASEASILTARFSTHHCKLRCITYLTVAYNPTLTLTLILWSSAAYC